MTEFLAGAILGALAAPIVGTILWDLPPSPETESEDDDATD